LPPHCRVSSTSAREAAGIRVPPGPAAPSRPRQGRD
jgi:hypothetical protein